MYAKIAFPVSQSRRLRYTCPLLAGAMTDAKTEMSALPVKYFAPQRLLILLLERDYFLRHILSFLLLFFNSRVSRNKGFFPKVNH